MTTLLIQAEQTQLSVHLPNIQSMSALQFQEFCLANRELRIERAANGEVVIMSPAFADTGNRNLKIAQQLANWSDQGGGGEVFDSSSGFTLPNGAIRSPDAAWIRSERWHSLSEAEQGSFAPLCPDFVIELRSASDNLTNLEVKLQEYIENGAVLGWLIDRKNRQVTVYRPNQSPDVLLAPTIVSADPELPGFVLQMERIW